MFVPHAICANGGGGKVGEDGGEGGIRYELDVVGCKMEFVSQKAKFIDAGCVRGVADRADEDEFGKS